MILDLEFTWVSQTYCEDRDTPHPSPSIGVVIENKQPLAKR